MLSPSGEIAKFRSIRLTSESLPQHGRVARWRNIFNRQIVRVEIKPLVEPFHFQTTIHSAPSLTFTSSTSTAAHIVRSSNLIDDGDSRLAIHILLDGGAAFLKGNKYILRPGDAVLLSNKMPFTLIFFEKSTRFLSIYFPAGQLEMLLNDSDSAIGSIISGDREPLQQLTRYLLGLEIDAPAQLTDRRAASIQIYDFAAFTFGAARNIPEIAKRRGIKSARFIAMKAYVLTNLIRPNLSAASVASVHQVSEGYVRKLFARRFGSFNTFVSDNRLRRVYAALKDDRLSDWPLNELIGDVGFRSPQFFHRAFKRKYGVTPSEVKADRRLTRIV